MAGLSDFHSLQIERVARIAGDAVVVTFAVPDTLREVFRFKPGQHIAVRATIDGSEQRRNYSICAGPGEPLRIAIKARGGRTVLDLGAHASARRNDARRDAAVGPLRVAAVGWHASSDRCVCRRLRHHAGARRCAASAGSRSGDARDARLCQPSAGRGDVRGRAGGAEGQAPRPL